MKLLKFQSWTITSHPPKHLLKLIAFTNPELKISRGAIKDWLDSAAAAASISASRRIFLARNCKEWCTD